MAKGLFKGNLVIAGPGAGKTHNMVDSISQVLPDVKPCRYIVVITYTNSAANNIRDRLEKRINLPENLFIGTIHSFLNRFVVIPFASHADDIKHEKLFLQCSIDNVLEKVKKVKNLSVKDVQAAAKLKARITTALNTKGYITYDQTLTIAKKCFSKIEITRILGNRIQYLFVDEFQDSGNDIFSIIEALRKNGKTQIYCVGDPEQYIQSYNSTIRTFTNIPILKAAASTGYNVLLNQKNYRSTSQIIKFLNNFNGRLYEGVKFQQIEIQRNTIPPTVREDSSVYFINLNETVIPILDRYYNICDRMNISKKNRSIIAKRNEVIKRIIVAVDNHYMNPKSNSSITPMKAIEDTLLSTLQLSKTQFCELHHSNPNALRKYAIKIFKAIQSGIISNENTYGLFLREQLDLQIKKGLPIKVENLHFDYKNYVDSDVVTVSNIHNMKGLESEAVLVIAKTQNELLLWLETDHQEREKKRTNELTDYPRLGYVAFSRAKNLLCIACLEPISTMTEIKLKLLEVQLVN